MEGGKVFIHYNPNPDNLMTDDCVIRAICKALDKPWQKVYMDLCIHGLKMSNWGNNNAVWDDYLIEKGFVREVVKNTCPNCYTVEDFCQDHPTGTYILSTGRHVVTVIDGDFYDSYYSGTKVPMYAYRKKEA
jgi:hypothetical protein